jgi:DNA-binding transcriptional LysR family regulator
MLDYEKYVYEVYREKSFSRAAQKMRVSQPWLSAVVKKEEKRIHFPIFDRHKTPIEPTEEGKYYIEKVEQMLSLQDEMEEHFRQLRENDGKELCIGSSMFFCTYVLPSLLEQFRTIYPDVTFTMTEGTGNGLWEKLEKKKVDIVLEAEHPHGHEFISVPWGSEELVLGVPADNPINQKLEKYGYSFEEFLARRKAKTLRPAVPLKEFKDQSFIFLKKDNDSHDRGFAMCHEAGFEPSVFMYVSQMMTAYYLVCEGKGIALLRSAIPSYVSPTDRVRFYLIDSPLSSRNIYLVYMKEQMTDIKKKMIESLLEEGGAVY